MKKSVIFSYSAALLGLLLTSGCGNEAPPPPTEKAELVVRFFSSIQKRDFQSAMRQGIKLRALDNHNENISKLVEIQQCNAYIGSVQKHLNAGRINQAAAILQKGVNTYPDNITLRNLLPKVRQLRNAKNLINGMERASDSISMRSALMAAKIGMAANTTARLNRYFANYEKRIAAAEKQERLQKLERQKKAEEEQKKAEEERKKAEQSAARPDSNAEKTDPAAANTAKAEPQVVSAK